jgi:hypothetical protein
MTTIKTTNSNGVTHEVTIASNDVAGAMVTGMQAMKHAWKQECAVGNQWGYIYIFRHSLTNELVHIYEGLQG